MKLFLLAALAAALFCVTVPAGAQEFSDQQFCTESKAAAKTLKAQGPQWVDQVTRQDGFYVDCPSKSLLYQKFVNVESTKMEPGWEDGMQTASNEYYCSNESLSAAIANGWAVTVAVTLADKKTLSLTVYCDL